MFFTELNTNSKKKNVVKMKKIKMYKITNFPKQFFAKPYKDILPINLYIFKVIKNNEFYIVVLLVDVK